MRALGMLGALLLAGCGGTSGRANVSPAPMPDGGSFTGVWFSPQYGEMHMVQSGASVVAEYTKDERSGRIQGTVNGNLLRFEWVEERELVSGVPQVLRGRGYFQYRVGEDRRHNLLGRWGIDDAEVGGGEWNAYRLRNRQPEMSHDQTGMASSEESVTPFEGGGGSDYREPLDTGSDSSADEDLDLDGLDF